MDKREFGFTEAGLYERKPVSLRGYDVKAASVASSNPGGGESLVQQHFAEDADINVIMRRFKVTGQMPFGSAQGVYGDFTEITDYESAVGKIERANQMFMRLPPEVREKFKNDPGEMIRRSQEMSEEDFVSFSSVEPVAPVVETDPA